MAKELEEYLRRYIATHGALDVGQFMSIALAHPEHGYYMTRDPFGAGGDFTTAPEISQMFGEMIGAWVIDIWAQMGKPERLTLVECGPGRGTLMNDILRVYKDVPLDVHLIEISPALKFIQQKTLKAHWHDNIETVPTDAPVIVIGNEFLDALPFRQFVKTKDGWAERVITEDLSFGLRPIAFVKDAPEGSIFEIAPHRIEFIKTVEDLMKRCGMGAALFIDYGHAQSGLGDTFQALHKHNTVDVLSHIGEADLTSHVDFSVFGHPVTTQGEFLRSLGIEARAQMLLKNANERQSADIASALHRLTSSDEMGTLFKVMGFAHGKNIHPAGF